MVVFELGHFQITLKVDSSISDLLSGLGRLLTHYLFGVIKNSAFQRWWGRVIEQRVSLMVG